MKQLLKTVARTFFQDYELYKVYRSPVLRQTAAQSIRSDVYEISSASDERFAAAPATFQYLSSYFGSESVVTGIFVGHELATVAVFWYGDRYKTRVVSTHSISMVRSLVGRTDRTSTLTVSFCARTNG